MTPKSSLSLQKQIILRDFELWVGSLETKTPEDIQSLKDLTVDSYKNYLQAIQTMNNLAKHPWFKPL